MKLLLSKRFQSDLEKILVFYSQKSFEASENFYNSLFNKLKSIELCHIVLEKIDIFTKTTLET